MSTPEPPPAGRRNRVVLPATCSAHQAPRGRTMLAVTKLADGRIEFDPHLSGACAFTVEEDELIKILLRWGVGAPAELAHAHATESPARPR